MTTRTVLTVGALYRAGWRSYQLRSGDRAIGSIERRGLLKTKFEVGLGGTRLYAVQQGGGELEFYDGDELVVRTANVARRRVRVDIRDDGVVEFERSGWRSRWSTSRPSDDLRMVLAPHPGFWGGPVVTLHAGGRVDLEDDPLLIAVGLCLVLAYRTLTLGWARGSAAVTGQAVARNRLW